eukprot:7144979-Ditylum_brightwellii.AAC.1
MFYVTSLNKYTNVHLDLVIVNGDSPEFHDAKKLSHGNSSHTSIRGWLFNISEIWPHIPSCKNCYKIMLEKPRSWKLIFVRSVQSGIYS